MRGEPRARRAATAAGVLVLAALPWAWFGVRDLLGPVGDVVAIVLPVLVVAVAVVGVVVWRRRAVLPVVSLLLAGAVAIVAPWTPADAGTAVPGRAVTVASANVTGLPGTVPALRAVSADVLVVVENSTDVDARLSAAYPHHLHADGPPWTGVYSRYPVRLLEPPGPDLPGVRVAVGGPSPFVVYAVHVPKPWWRTGGGGYYTTPAGHHRLVRALAARVARERGPVVVAGDLNSTDRGRDYRLLTAGLTDAMRDGWAAPTSVTTWRPFLLRIDHLLVGPGWCGDAARRFALPGSDHDGITATIGPCTAA